MLAGCWSNVGGLVSALVRNADDANEDAEDEDEDNDAVEKGLFEFTEGCVDVPRPLMEVEWLIDFGGTIDDEEGSPLMTSLSPISSFQASIPPTRIIGPLFRNFLNACS